MTLDYASIFFFLALNNLFIIVLFIYQYFYQHKYWYLMLLTLSIIFQTVAIFLFSNHNIFPVLNTVLINNFLMISSFAIASFGLISFDGKVRKNLIWIFSISVLLFYSAILIAENNLTVIHITRTLSCSFFYGISAFYLFNHKSKYKFSLLLSCVLFVYSIFQLIRVFDIYQTGPDYSLLKVTTFNNWFLIISTFAISSCNVGFIMLLKEVDQKTILKKNLIIQKNQLKLEKLNQTQNKLFSIIAHDLRSPFNNILGLSELLLANGNKTNHSSSEEYINIINTTAQNTLALLDNLLNWARAQTEELSLNLETIMLSKIIHETIALKTSVAKAKNITIHYSPTDDLELYTDKNILGTILRNLISNAIKFTNQGGEINILTTINQDHIEISISDNGVGMNEKTIHTIFDLSSHISSIGTADEKGSGLGLVLCIEFVKKLGGHIGVKSEEGKGSDFKFTLPLNLSK
ncbi:sensor histidine kinase [Wenyingzhuangia marina]|uniref:histidine kinase n=2 Tax=Wenyingzhuangia marina TaxID=1195760 RepID=A0A1M5VXE9_9FLAO|nr:HAMP domain-containing sensor histidine kinase [Wenyingzhuangia marina]SHH79878.1 His Kinase A (phospho-acceptor) domain-containing protein [Wenyingzhuangia marina]